MRTHVFFWLPAILCALFTISDPALSLAESKSRSVGDPYGIVTGLIGQAAGVMRGASRELRIGDRVAVGEDVLVAAGTLEILWERRALFSLEGRTRIAVQEAKNGLALLEIQEGAVQVAYSYNEGHPTDTLTVRTPATRTVLRGGIIEAKVERAGTENHVQMGKPRQAAGTAGELLRMIEGQAQVEPLLNTGAKPFLLKVGYEFQVSPGGSDTLRPAAAFGARKLAAVSSHEHVPPPTIQRLVRIHVDHALEIERALNKPSRDGNEAEGSVGGMNGAIVATSLGIPLTAISGTGGSVAAASAVPTFSSGPAVGGGAPTATPPVPVPIIQTPGVTVLTPSQSGGINSQSLLRDVLQDVVGKGHGKGGGKN